MQTYNTQPPRVGIVNTTRGHGGIVKRARKHKAKKK